MGTVERGFMPLRMAQRWVEIYKKDGEDTANMWYSGSRWRPSPEEFQQFNQNINKIVNK